MSDYRDPRTLPDLHVIDVVEIARQVGALSPRSVVGWCQHRGKAFMIDGPLTKCVCGSEEVAYLEIAEAINWMIARAAAVSPEGGDA
jgi:hypothetical protein